MSDLGPQARALLKASRGADSLTDAHRARIKRGVLLHLASFGTTAAASGSTVAMTLTTKLTVVGLALAVVGGGSAFLVLQDGPRVEASSQAAVLRPSPPPAPMPARVTSPEPTQVTSAQPQEPRVPARKNAARGPARSSPTGKATEAVSASASGIGSLEPELTVLEGAQEELRRGKPALALARLAEYDRVHGAGALSQERRALSAIASCQFRPGSESQEIAEAFLRSAPDSPLSGRVRLACGKTRR